MGGSGVATVAEKGVARSKSDAFLDEALLRRIATSTGGTYFRATDKESLQLVYRQIDLLEKSEIQMVTKTRFGEQFPYFILAALFFLALDIFLRYTYLRSFP